jgi:hypothetical protein
MKKKISVSYVYQKRCINGWGAWSVLTLEMLVLRSMLGLSSQETIGSCVLFSPPHGPITRRIRLLVYLCTDPGHVRRLSEPRSPFEWLRKSCLERFLLLEDEGTELRVKGNVLKIGPYLRIIFEVPYAQQLSLIIMQTLLQKKKLLETCISSVQLLTFIYGSILNFGVMSPRFHGIHGIKLQIYKSLVRELVHYTVFGFLVPLNLDVNESNFICGWLFYIVINFICVFILVSTTCLQAPREA